MSAAATSSGVRSSRPRRCPGAVGVIRITRAVAAVSALWLAIASSAAGPLLAQDEIFQRGNQLYQAGDYGAAVEAYEAVLASGFESHELHYNLGNAYFKTGDLGRSILSWERALRFEPGAALPWTRSSPYPASGSFRSSRGGWTSCPARSSFSWWAWPGSA